METSLTHGSITALFGTMIVLAFIPSASVLVVSAKSAACGFTHGVFTTIGIVVGDIIFIILAIYGLSIVAELMGSRFSLVKYLGGTYLVWLGITLWRSNSSTGAAENNTEPSLLSSFMTGLLITLGDQKAILLYLGFFPAFLDLSSVTLADTSIIILITTLAVGGAKLVYAYMADRANLLLASPAAARIINVAAGTVIISVGVLLVVNTLMAG
jgi:threonine/homoserine/homoserine lactone efflux protein